MSDRKQIKISDVLDLLKQGKTRADIKEHYDLSHSGMKTLFQHEKLKGKKPHKQPDFELIDDTEADMQEAPADVEATQDSYGEMDRGTSPDHQAGNDQQL